MNHYKKMLDGLDDLMIALSKQKQLGLDPAIILALKNLTKARNAFKTEYIKANTLPKEARRDTVFTHFLDNVGDLMCSNGPTRRCKVEQVCKRQSLKD